jgi:hypothetical protein
MKSINLILFHATKVLCGGTVENGTVQKTLDISHLK